ncbi:MAG: dipeptidyl-peptidase 3 family protein [Bacteroidales bacterium]
MKIKWFYFMMGIVWLSACKTGDEKDKQTEFKWQVDRFADLKILRYQVPGWDSLSLQQKELVYYLSQAALCGRDIVFDQNYKYNLAVRRTLEAVYENFKGERDGNDWNEFMVYLKRVWFSNGIHHHYSTDKFFPGFNQAWWLEVLKQIDEKMLPLPEGMNKEQFMPWITDIMFNSDIAPKRVNLDPSQDLIAHSACNFYEGVTTEEVEQYYGGIKIPDPIHPISLGLNTKVVKKNGKIVEVPWIVGGLYGQALEKVVYWLEKAKSVAEDERQREGLGKLIEYYRTGDLKTWDDYNVLWVEDTSFVDYVNGFIEVYGDPLGRKATWESVVDFRNEEATHRTKIISANAQWFEDHSPIDPKFRKKEVKGVSAKVITVAQLGGDCYPSTPIGINLPNADWIRKEHGSKSVTMENITYSYNQASLGTGFLEEFCYSPEEVELAKKYGPLADNLHTDLHECLGHGSGQLLPGVSSEALRNYHSPIEEARADLFALYFLMDPKMQEIGLVESDEVAKAEYNAYIRNGLMTQLTRIEPGKNIEQAHMRNRQLIARWCYEKGQKDNVIEKKVKDGKTYFVVNDHRRLRELFGELLAEIQRIKSTGDYEAARNLVETYGVKVDADLHREVLERYAKLNLAPYGGFMNPVFEPVYKDGKLVDILVSYPEDYVEQMMYYSKNYSFLPTYN